MCKTDKTQIVFATNNAHKLSEVREILGSRYDVLSLRDINCFDDIPETADTIMGNALLKVQYVKEHFGYDCFADDTGLEVAALGGEPGVHSARYDDSTDHDSVANMRKLLRNLEGVSDRRARFLTVIALIQGSETHTFEGIVNGTITHERHGSDGFGYDPIFAPTAEELALLPSLSGTPTFAEMSSEEKNTISHRGRAIRKLVDYLTNKEQ